MKSVIAALAAAGLLAACSPPPPAVSPTTKPDKLGVTMPIPSDAVLWADLPSQQVAPPTALPATPPAANARPCRTSDLQAVAQGNGGATGNVFTRVIFFNRSANTCLLEGHPTVAIMEPGQPTVFAAPNNTWQVGSPANQPPGAWSSVVVVTTLACSGGTTAGSLYHELTVTLPRGGVMSLRLPQGISPRPCGALVTGFAVNGNPPVYPPDPLAGLAPSITVPATGRAGEELTYVVRIGNSSAGQSSLRPCPTYVQYGPVGVKQFLSLNCAKAEPIAPGGSEAFVMQMHLPAFAAGNTSICWAFADAAATSACAMINVPG